MKIYQKFYFSLWRLKSGASRRPYIRQERTRTSDYIIFTDITTTHLMCTAMHESDTILIAHCIAFTGADLRGVLRRVFCVYL